MIERLPELIETVRQGSKYHHIHEDLIRNIAMSELNKDRSWKETIKAVRNKIHQVGSAYQPNGIDYERVIALMKSLPRDIQNPLVKDFCRETMKQHASTRERLEILDQFYQTIFANNAPITSLLDVACGLNPLALAWIPLSSGSDVLVCDIYGDQIDFLNLFFDYFHMHGKAICCDLTQVVPEGYFQTALVLKTIPCLEQIDKKIGSRLLNSINSKNILVSFPAKSLGGRNKGMRQFYSAHFEEIIAEHNWLVDKFSFSNEEAFLVHK